MQTQAPTLFDTRREHYIELLKPIFLPEDAVSNDIIRYFASLLRVLGMEDPGWDPYAQSRAMLNDINGLFSVDLPEDRFPDANATTRRLGLLLYSHIVEMDAPYEVLTNLLRFRLGKGYSPNPFFDFLTEKQKKRSRSSSAYRRRPTFRSVTSSTISITTGCATRLRTQTTSSLMATSDAVAA